MAWKKYGAEYRLKDCQEKKDRCIGCRNITETMLQIRVSTIQSINQPFNWNLLPLVSFLLPKYRPINLMNLDIALYSINTLLTHLQPTGFENIVGKGEIARNEQFLLFPPCFLQCFPTMFSTQSDNFIILQRNFS